MVIEGWKPRSRCTTKDKRCQVYKAAVNSLAYYDEVALSSWTASALTADWGLPVIKYVTMFWMTSAFICWAKSPPGAAAQCGERIYSNNVNVIYSVT